MPPGEGHGSLLFSLLVLLPAPFASPLFFSSFYNCVCLRPCARLLPPDGVEALAVPLPDEVADVRPRAREPAKGSPRMGRSAGARAGWLVGWLVGWFVLVGWLVAWLHRAGSFPFGTGPLCRPIYRQRADAHLLCPPPKWPTSFPDLAYASRMPPTLKRRV